MMQRAFERARRGTWADMIDHLPVDPRSPAEVTLVRRTAENMVAAGELRPAGRVKTPCGRTWRTVYEWTSSGKDEAQTRQPEIARYIVGWARL